jgi:hypothetical protein
VLDSGAVDVLIVGQLSSESRVVAVVQDHGDITRASARLLALLINGHIHISVEITCRCGENCELL